MAHNPLTYLSKIDSRDRLSFVPPIASAIITFVFERYLRFGGRIPPNADLYVCILLALTAFAVYLRTLAPGVLDGDSGEWQYMAYILGIPHSTGYPLYILLAKLMTFLPLGTPAWRVNLLSAICAALAIPVVYLLAKRLARSRVVGLIAATFFAFMPTLWASATIAEVYALNTLLLALVLFFGLCFYENTRPHDLYGMALAFGLSLTHHRIAFFIAPALLFLIWLKRRALSLRVLLRAALCVLVPLSLYAYIPLRAEQLLAVQSPENWALYPRAEAIVNGKITAYYNHTPSGVFNLITALDNRNKLGFQDLHGENGLLPRLMVALELLREQMDPFALALTLMGIGVLWRRERALALWLLIAASAIAVVSLVLHAESTRFYFSGTYLILVLFLAVALGWVLEKLCWRPVLYYGAIAYFAFFPLTAWVLNFPRMDQSANTKYERYARAVLEDHLAPGAVLVAPWEIATPIRYLQYVEGVRPDVLTIHESPIRPQYQKILDAAHRLGRPFYYAQFTPEDRNATLRTIQAIAFPLPNKPQPRYAAEVKLDEAIRVVGYDWSPDPARPGDVARLSFYYEVLAPMQKEYIAELELADIRGVPHGSWSHRPVSEYHPTYNWKPGEYYRDVWDIPLDANIPKGLYRAQLTWYEFDSASNAIQEDTARQVLTEVLKVGDFAAATAAYAQAARFENGMQLLGYTIVVTPSRSDDAGQAAIEWQTAHPGDRVTVSLFWTALRQLDTSYTVFIHLTDAKGVVHAQADRPGWGGLYPTDRWPPGETVQDTYEFDLPSDLAPGTFQLQVGIYARPEAPQPVPLSNSSQDRVTLQTPIRVTR